MRDQGKANSCVGFALAHVIDVLRHSDDEVLSPERASARMLYEVMARRNDEWAESPHEGSSLRGGIKGSRNGVCSEAIAAPMRKSGNSTYEMAKAARETRLGAYFRLQPDISDYHAGLQEVGAIYCSAQIHTNWLEPKDGRIAVGGAPIGGHAFVIVGYDAEGFWVLNSWGETWGREGLAHWSYEDWAATVMDAWLLQLGVRAPSAFSAIPGSTPSSRSGLFGIGDPTRADILGHFINIDDGRLIETGKYAFAARRGNAGDGEAADQARFERRRGLFQPCHLRPWRAELAGRRGEAHRRLEADGYFRPQHDLQFPSDVVVGLLR